MDMITFGRFGNEEDWKKDKEIFLQRLNHLTLWVQLIEPTLPLYLVVRTISGDLKGLMNALNYSLDKPVDRDNEMELIEPIKQKIKEINVVTIFGSSIDLCMDIFVEPMGISYRLLTKKEKEEINKMDFSFDNWKKKSEAILDAYLKKSKEICPPEVHFCFDDIFFAIYVQTSKESNFTLKNFLVFIRDYFILESAGDRYDKYIDKKKFYLIREKVIGIYPELKEKFGRKDALGRFLSFFVSDTDYNFEIVKNILDNYNKNKNNNKINDDEKIKLKNDWIFYLFYNLFYFIKKIIFIFYILIKIKIIFFCTVLK